MEASEKLFHIIGEASPLRTLGQAQIDFKILLIVFKCLNGMGPEYLCSMLCNFAHFDHSIYLVEPRTLSS